MGRRHPRTGSPTGPPTRCASRRATAWGSRVTSWVSPGWSATRWQLPAMGLRDTGYRRDGRASPARQPRGPRTARLTAVGLTTAPRPLGTLSRCHSPVPTCCPSCASGPPAPQAPARSGLGSRPSRDPGDGRRPGRWAAGKTQLAKGSGVGLGVRDVVNSPSFTLMAEYEGRLPMFHQDLYRLEGAEDASRAGSWTSARTWASRSLSGPTAWATGSTPTGWSCTCCPRPPTASARAPR